MWNDTENWRTIYVCFLIWSLFDAIVLWHIYLNPKEQKVDLIMITGKKKCSWKIQIHTNILVHFNIHVHMWMCVYMLTQTHTENKSCSIHEEWHCNAQLIQNLRIGPDISLDNFCSLAGALQIDDEYSFPFNPCYFTVAKSYYSTNTDFGHHENTIAEKSLTTTFSLFQLNLK